MGIRQALIEKLLSDKVFWSNDTAKLPDISDDVLIAETLIHLDIHDINHLFKIFSKRQIKKVWLEKLIPQGEYLTELNRLLAWLYFDIKKPDIYLKSALTRYYNKLSML